MTFYRSNPTMTAQLQNLLEELEDQGRNGLKNNIGVSWISYDRHNPKPGNGSGINWRGSENFYPASVVKIIYG